jgi:HSP20 family protein
MLPILLRKQPLPTIRENFFDGINSLFDELFTNDTLTTLSETFTSYTGDYPKVDVTDYEDRVEIVAGVSGLRKEDIAVEVKPGLLTIKGNKEQKNEEKKGGKVVVRELKHSSFQRSFGLTRELDANSIHAKFDNGILTVVVKKLPKLVEPEVKQIEIK